MKTQAPVSTLCSVLVSTMVQKNEIPRYQQITDTATGLPFSSTKMRKAGDRNNNAINQKEYSADERKLRADAFVERSGRLKYYIGLIQLKVVT